VSDHYSTVVKLDSVSANKIKWKGKTYTLVSSIISFRFLVFNPFDYNVSSTIKNQWGKLCVEWGKPEAASIKKEEQLES
jgi:hypothetical protein